MKFKRILAFLPMMLAALWLPKTFLAWLDYGYVGAAQILDSDADMPNFWCGWFTSLILMGLVHGWFLLGIKKLVTLQMITLVLVAR